MKDKKQWFCDNVNELQNGMYRVAYSILKNEMDSQDAVQEGIISAYKNIESLKETKKFKPWMYKIITNTSLQLLKSKKDYLNIDDEQIEAENIDVDTHLTLWNTVQTLKQPYRTTLTLFYYENMTIKEISNITGTKEDAIKKQLSRGREKIKEDLGNELF